MTECRDKNIKVKFDKCECLLKTLKWILFYLFVSSYGFDPKLC